MRSTCVFYAAMLAVMASPAFGAEEVVQVGFYGEPSRLAIQGARSFDPAEIAHALATDLDVALASCSDRPLAELKTLLTDKVRLAYLRDGFADVRVEIDQEPSRLVLNIDEGRQFHAGEIRFSGARSFDVQSLVSALTTKREGGLPEGELMKLEDRKSAGSAVRWPVGEPAPLDEFKRQDLIERVEYLLRGQGYFGAQFSISPELDRQGGTVTLHVVLANEGVRQTAANLEIVGNDRNSREVILNYLSLRTDRVLTAEVGSHLEKTLDDSGRFVKAEWHASSDKAPNRPRLELGEYDQAPPLDQPLSREETALLNLYRWMQQFNDGAEEISGELALAGVRGGFVCAAQNGLVAWVAGLPGGRPPADGAPPPVDLALISTDNEIGLYSYRGGRKLSSAVTPTPVMLKLGLALARDRPELDGQGQFNFGLGFTTANLQKNRYCEFRFSQSAVGAISLAHQKDATFQWHGDVLTILRGGYRYVIESRTGRLLEFAQLGDKASQVAGMHFSQGEFLRKLGELQAPADRFQNFTSLQSPLSCIAAYACEEAAYWSVAAKVSWAADFANAFRKLVDKGLLAPFDKVLLAPETHDPKFTIAFRNFRVNSRDDTPGTVSAYVRHRGIEFGDRLAPRGSWPWQMSREAMFVAAGKRERLAQQLDGLKEGASGPIRCLTASKLLDAAGLKTEARDVARAGLKKTSLTEFRNDYRPLLQRGFYVGDHLLRLAQMLRELDETEIVALARGATALGLLDERGSQLLVEAVGRLREQSGEAVDRLLPAILDDLWAAGLREAIERALESAATIPPPPFSFEVDLQQRLKDIEKIKQVLSELDLPPDELKQRLKKIEEIEQMLKKLDELKNPKGLDERQSKPKVDRLPKVE